MRATRRALAAWPVHNDHHAGKNKQATDQIKNVRSDVIDLPAPQEAHDNKEAAVGSVDSAKMRRLKSRYYAVCDQDYCAQTCVPHAFVLAQPEPHEIAAADLTQSCQHKISD